MAAAKAPLPDLEHGTFPQHRRGDSNDAVGVSAGEDDDGVELEPAAAAASSSSSSSNGGVFVEVKVDVGVLERDCRICQQGLGSNGDRSIDLGCSCKGDLGSAHKDCAEDWFKIRGNRTCEICNSVARNIATPNEGEQTGHVNDANINVMPVSVASSLAAHDHRSFWHGHRFLNFLLACMVVAFVISWLFHFRVPRR